MERRGKMFEQDYVMRLIKEMIRVLLKLFFNMDTQSPDSGLLKDAETKASLERLLDMAEQGRINEAENELYELADGSNMQALEAALLFYSYLNEKDDCFLKDNQYSREEIKTGIRDIALKYGLETEMLDMFMS